SFGVSTTDGFYFNTVPINDQGNPILPDANGLPHQLSVTVDASLNGSGDELGSGQLAFLQLDVRKPLTTYTVKFQATLANQAVSQLSTTNPVDSGGTVTGTATVSTVTAGSATQDQVEMVSLDSGSTGTFT